MALARVAQCRHDLALERPSGAAFNGNRLRRRTLPDALYLAGGSGTVETHGFVQLAGFYVCAEFSRAEFHYVIGIDAHHCSLAHRR